MVTNLYINKGVSTCIKAAQTLLTQNFKALAHKLWPVALINSILLTVVFLINIPDKALNDMGLSHPVAALIIMVVTYLLLLVSSAFFSASIASWINEGRLRGNLLRAFAIVGVELIVLIISSLIMTHVAPLAGKAVVSSGIANADKAPIIGFVVMVVVLLAFWAFALPLTFSTTRYQIDHKTHFVEVFTKGYKTGLCHWGYEFLSYFVAALLSIVASFIAFIPLFIATLAQAFNQLGMLNGDPDGAPAYFPWLLIITSIVSMMLYCIVFTWMYLVVCQTYGSVETREQQRLEAKRNNVVNN